MQANGGTQQRRASARRNQVQQTQQDLEAAGGQQNGQKGSKKGQKKGQKKSQASQDTQPMGNNNTGTSEPPQAAADNAPVPTGINFGTGQPIYSQPVPGNNVITNAPTFSQAFNMFPLGIGGTVNTGGTPSGVLPAQRAIDPVLNARAAAPPVNPAAAAFAVPTNVTNNAVQVQAPHVHGENIPAANAPAVAAFPPGVDVAALMNLIQSLQQQLAARETDSGNGNAVAGPSRGTRNRGGHNHQLPTVPKPKGSAGGGKRGFNLREAMGLDEDEDSQLLYNLILSEVRRLAHAARLDVSKTYRQVSKENLSKIFSAARQKFPMLARFDNDWATSEMLRQYLGSARRYGRRMGFFDCHNEAVRSHNRNLDDFHGDDDDDNLCT